MPVMLQLVEIPAPQFYNLSMSFKEDFKALLEELVLPEIDTLKSQIGEERVSIGGELRSNADSLKSDIDTLSRSFDAKLDTLTEALEGLSTQVERLKKSLGD